MYIYTYGNSLPIIIKLAGALDFVCVFPVTRDRKNNS